MRKAIIFIALIFLATAFKLGQEVTTPQQCIETKCPTQWAACQKDPKCQPALADCEKKCGTKASCWTFCLPSKGSQPAIDVAKCAQAQGCDKARIETSLTVNTNPEDCINKYCKKEEQACQNDRRCVQVLDFCDSRCNTTISCWKDCLNKSKEVNATNYFNCVIQHNCLNATTVSNAVAIAAPIDCIKEKCPTQWAACLKDPKCQPALNDCEKKCGTKASCWSFCLPSKGSQAAIDTAKCAQAQGCDKAQENALALFTPQECIQQHCSKEAGVCQKDRRCLAALQDCEKECRDNQTCWTTCLAKKGNAPANDLWKCIIDNDCFNKVETAIAVATPRDCLIEKCPTQWAACQKDPKCIPALDDCDQKCGTKASCWTLCLPPKGSQAAIDAAKCAQAQGCDKAKVQTALALFTPQECIQQHCSNEIEACKTDRGCLAALLACQRDCKDNQTCWTTCLAKQGNAPASAYWKCIIDNDCFNKVETAVAIATPRDCLIEKCPTQWAACQKDPKCIPALDDCDQKCGTKASCWTLCLPPKGSQAAIDAAKCAQAQGCDKAQEIAKVETAIAIAAPIDCIKEKCPTQWAACLKDPKCQPALNDCEKKCGTKASCWSFCLPSKGSQAAIDTAKCAQAQGCDKAKVENHPFIMCMQKSCISSQLQCLYDRHCSLTLHKCATEKSYDYDFECLFDQAKHSPVVSAWYTCAGENFCL